ncbi:hypothetical protein WOLCODRAFT_165172 [Wolfiporia cocos MD-104 SS10]|uniref:Uncharacterized protein n=1 Tax=Wolfiporia cocos (strain MD-104) TaxID=742152 RepID=A0A2H3JSK6_WOLCO|nr:hypothetical protein WOLCODRAFT_165172 [Wolfiporia cocos MD-104 SS10]
MTRRDISVSTAIAILNGFGYKESLEDIRPFPSDWPIKGCYLTNAPAIFHANWVPVLAFETVLFVMMSVKCYSHRNLREIPILQRIWRDGTIYYLVILGKWPAPHAFLSDTDECILYFGINVAGVWIVAIFSYSGAHLLLSVRALVEARNSAEVQTPVISEIVRDIGTDVVNESDPQPVEAHELLPASCSLEPEGSGLGNRVGSREVTS